MNSVLHPWWLARRGSAGRLVVQSIVLVALLFGIGLHSSRACAMWEVAFTHAAVSSDPCHQSKPGVDACLVHCESDGQSARVLSIDLPALAPILAVRIEPVAPLDVSTALASDSGAWQRAGPPLHVLLRRLLR